MVAVFCCTAWHALSARCCFRTEKLSKVTFEEVTFLFFLGGGGVTSFREFTCFGGFTNSRQILSLLFGDPLLLEVYVINGRFYPCHRRIIRLGRSWANMCTASGYASRTSSGIKTGTRRSVVGNASIEDELHKTARPDA